MADLVLSGATSGSVTLSAPAVSGSTTLTLPTTSGTVLTSASDLTAQVKSATNATGSAPIYTCRAWVNFNGVGTVAIRSSGNVSSITDGGTGIYTANFTTAMPDVNYACFAGSSAEVTESNRNINFSTLLTGSALFRNIENGIPADSTNVYFCIFR